ncbi:maleylpyruvate isomerase N-terminal domain-containing protein [Nonomuraea sp. NPDC052265]|uniref:maleylpyruvate isomerase N-terminal domain-containing protein n=1 Tax=Nonomuraea sp. NPDC052265 TaxID=3364374 RepID=UPI0037C5A455
MPDLALLDTGTAYFLDRLRAAGLDRPSALPGWTGRHVAAHVSANANALGRLARWARTGEKALMYASARARDAEIEELALLPSDELGELVRTTAAELRAVLGVGTAGQWAARVRTAQGREVAAAEVVWMRTREVWVHGADLGGRFEDFPDALVDGLIEDVVGTWDARGQGPWMTLRATDRPALWHVAPPLPDAAEATVQEAKAPEAQDPKAQDPEAERPEAQGPKTQGPKTEASAVEGARAHQGATVGPVAAVGPPVVVGTAAALAARLTGRGQPPASGAPPIGRLL